MSGVVISMVPHVADAAAHSFASYITGVMLGGCQGCKLHASRLQIHFADRVFTCVCSC